MLPEDLKRVYDTATFYSASA